MRRFSGRIGLLVLVLFAFPLAAAMAADVLVTDSLGRELRLPGVPQRVVSLVPSAAEILFALGCGDNVAGVTIHDTSLPGAWDKPLVGGYFSPNPAAIRALNPDLIIAAPLHRKLLESLSGAPALIFETRSLAGSEENIQMLGGLFGKADQARAIIDRNRAELDLIRQKTERIPEKGRLRVMRFMGRDTVMTPGDDSYQNELIAAAGGIPPRLGKTGDVVPVTLEEFQAFDPQFIYGCGGDLPALRELLDRPGWRDVDAVKNNRIQSLPCDLTCRAATHTGYFAAWLASLVYTEAFADPARHVLPEEVTRRRPIELDLPLVRSAGIAYSIIDDFTNKSLIIEFNSPQTVVSTLEGQRSGITAVGNHFSPPPCWAPGHLAGLESIRKHVYRVLGRAEKETSFLFTGADMDNLSVQTTGFRDMSVTALVTAGVRSNAVRMSRDSGDFYEPGTINIIILTNMALTPRAMSRAVISATEAKTAALWDMDVRSTYTPLVNPATGTGTDEVLVVSGQGVKIDNAGGHVKMGELIARAVYAGVREAVLKQNGLVGGRSVFDRLAERGISLYALAGELDCECRAGRGGLSGLVEELLLNPRYASFVEAALAVSDARERQSMADLAAFRDWGKSLAEEIAGRPLDALTLPEFQADLPVVVREALGCLFTGIVAREQGR